MSRHARVAIRVSHPLAGSAAAVRFGADPASWLPAVVESRGRGRWRLPLSLGGVHRHVALELGDAWRDGADTWRACAWRPQEERGDWIPGPLWLPSFAGSLGVCRRGASAADLVLEGAYRPPFGFAGRAVDRLLLGRLARRSARELLASVAACLAPESYRPRAASVALRSAR
ncbi:MAG TPA: hypothetical protein VNU01_06405 [Egibacteraceae bacterium]|nr:hypothetical protein [Egibacteraceae bacterium]